VTLTADTSVTFASPLGTFAPILAFQSIKQSISQKITTYKSDQWCTTHLKTKIKPKDNVQKVKKLLRDNKLAETVKF